MKNPAKTHRGRKDCATPLRLVGGLLLVTALAACQAAAPRVPGPSAAPGAPPATAETETWRQELADRWEKVSSFGLEGKISFVSDDGVYPGRLTLAMKKPGKMRADFFDPFGNLKGLVVMAGGEALEYLPQKPDPVKPSELLLLTRLAGRRGGSPAEEMAALAAGLPGTFVTSLPARWGEEKIAAPGTKPDEAVYLSRQQGNLLVQKAVFLGEKQEVYRVEYEDYGLVDGLPMPGKVTIRLPESGWSLVIKVQMREMNAALGDDLFRTEVIRELL